MSRRAWIYIIAVILMGPRWPRLRLPHRSRPPRVIGRR